MSDEVEIVYCFPCAVYVAQRPEYLEVVRQVSADILAADTDQLCQMTGDFSQDSRLADFARYVAETGLEILAGQGHDMAGASAYFSEMWTQEHHRNSLMERHVHGNGAQLSGFYFLDTPDGCSKALYHDPRSGKVQISLPEANPAEVTPASNTVGFDAQPGTLIIANSWLPHSFSRHMADSPIRFVHFNIGVEYSAEQLPEVI
jgi:uncharacterized protein (TIGR02466 family)